MALDATRLKNALKAGIEQQVRSFLGLGATPYPDLTSWSEAVGKAIADEVVKEIKDNAELDGAKFSGSFSGTVSGATCSTTITDQPVTGKIK